LKNTVAKVDWIVWLVRQRLGLRADLSPKPRGTFPAGGLNTATLLLKAP
jgi:hypothetical protein